MRCEIIGKQQLVNIISSLDNLWENGQLEWVDILKSE